MTMSNEFSYARVIFKNKPAPLEFHSLNNRSGIETGQKQFEQYKKISKCNPSLKAKRHRKKIQCRAACLQAIVRGMFED